MRTKYLSLEQVMQILEKLKQKQVPCRIEINIPGDGTDKYDLVLVNLRIFDPLDI